jgi:hypothetical protein
LDGEKAIMNELRYLFVSLCCLLSSLFAYGNEDKKVLRWGSDANSGAPYVFRDANNPNKIIGVDADIIQALAEHLGMKAEFVQNQWFGLACAKGAACDRNPLRLVYGNWREAQSQQPDARIS